MPFNHKESLDDTVKWQEQIPPCSKIGSALEKPQGAEHFVNWCALDDTGALQVAPGHVHHVELPSPGGQVTVWDEALGAEQCERWQQWMRQHACVPTGVDGRTSSYSEQDQGYSYRASIYTQRYARQLFDALPEELKRIIRVGEDDGLDAPIGSYWKPIGINPLWRGIYYKQGIGQLQVHYDAPFIKSDAVRSLRSVVIYLNEVQKGGQTRFWHSNVLLSDKSKVCYEDASAKKHCGALVGSIDPKQGRVLIFDHRRLHDACAPWSGDKMLWRTDLMYECINEGEQW